LDAKLFQIVAQSPAVHTLRQRLEKGELCLWAGIAEPARPFLASLLNHALPQTPIIAVTDGLKTQETFHQDAETWLRVLSSSRRLTSPEIHEPSHSNQEGAGLKQPGDGNAKCLFYPGWEILPHEAKLPHVDVISERLEVLAALLQYPGQSKPPSQAPLVVTTATALMQRTFAPQTLRSRTRELRRGDRIDPLDLVEWLEDQSYEPEAQVTQKGEISLRGGILDIFPPTSPWPVRLEFFRR
jgi:transcription-repair coupling factor (superfamily II helicase)